MTIKEYNKAITLLIHLIVLNNAGAVARALQQAGYPVKNYIPAAELEAALLQLHMANRTKFFEVMNNVSWNYGDLATNTVEIQDELKKLAGVPAGTATAKMDIWGTLIGLLLGGPSAPAPPPPPAVNTWAIVGLSLVVVGVIIAIIVIIRK